MGKPTFVVWSPRHTKELLHLDIFDMQNLGCTLSRSVDDIYGIFAHIPYLTQERVDKPRACLSAATMINMIKGAGYNRLVTLDMHASALETALGVAKLKAEHFLTSPIFSTFLLALAKGRRHAENLRILGLVHRAGESDPERTEDVRVQVINPLDFVSASTDLGGHKRAMHLAEDLVGKQRANGAVATVVKERDPVEGTLTLSNVIGPDLEGKTVIIVDDLLRSAKTIEIAAQAIKNAGAARIMAFITHPEMNDGADIRCQTLLQLGLLDLLAVTNSIEIPAEKRFPGLTQILLDPILAAVIKAEATHHSASEAFWSALRGPMQAIRYT
jgi:ribose-phosphate pyrophosphokinase